MTDPHSAARPLALDAMIVMLKPGKGDMWSHANLGVAAALLVELTREGRLLVTGAGQRREVVAQDTTPVGDELLDEALQIVASSQNPRVTKLITMLPKSDRVLDRLLAEGMVTVEPARKFGLWKVERHHPTPAAGRDALMTTLRNTFLGTVTPDARSAMLFSVLDIGPDLIATFPRAQRPELARRGYAIRETIGEGEAGLVTTIDTVVGQANNMARNSIVN